MRWAYLGQLREDLGLEVWNFLLIVRTIAQLWISVPTYRNSFNDEVNIREILKLGAGGQPSTRCICIFLRQPSLSHVFSQ
jgi:hypothetical protein